MTVLLLLPGPLVGSTPRQCVYQMALAATKYDNGYVITCFLLVPAPSSLISFMLSCCNLGLRFVRAMFFVDLAPGDDLALSCSGARRIVFSNPHSI
jgi:hypothetical protein